MKWKRYCPVIFVLAVGFLLGACASPSTPTDGEDVVVIEITATPAPTEAPTGAPSETPEPTPTSTKKPLTGPLATAAALNKKVTLSPPTPIGGVKVEGPDDYEGLVRQAWNIVNNNYVRDNFNGVDWDAVLDKYLAMVENVETQEELWTQQAWMIAELNDQHSRFIAPPDLDREFDLNSNRLIITDQIMFQSLTGELYQFEQREWSHQLVNQDPRIGYIRVPDFSGNAAFNIMQAIKDMEDGGELAGLIVDVRDNPGGNSDQSIGVFATGVIGTMGPLREDKTRTVYRIPGPVDWNETTPVAVLINGSSHSAAEYFAAGMKELDRAIIVGVNSAGNIEGITGFNLADGSLIRLAVTTLVLNDGTILEGIGVTPDVYITYQGSMDLDPPYDPQIQGAVEALLP
ncbi:MAG: S41 family peptidase [Anaerolineales bacterium]|nr:S41 family peptidase [Anaerolineales bacterium]